MASLNLPLPMNPRFINLPSGLCRAILVTSALTLVGHATTIDWGSVIGSQFVDSTGQALTGSNYVFELGSFSAGFDPTKPVAEWATYWKTFDRAVYNEDETWRNFGSSADLNGDGSSSSAYASTYNFSDQDAFLWIRNTDGTGDAFDPNGQFLLTRAASWAFPTAGSDCCGGLPLQWSVSDVISNNTCAGTNVPLLTTGTAATSGMVYGVGTVFEWDLSYSAPERGVTYDGVEVIGDVNVADGAIFKIVLGEGMTLDDAFWNEGGKTWADVFTASGGSLNGLNNFSIQVFEAGSCTPLDVSGKGYFYLSGGDLVWVPEPTGALVALLLAAGLLRRRR